MCVAVHTIEGLAKHRKLLGPPSVHVSEDPMAWMVEMSKGQKWSCTVQKRFTLGPGVFGHFLADCTLLCFCVCVCVHPHVLLIKKYRL